MDISREKTPVFAFIRNPTSLVPWKPMSSAKRNKKNLPPKSGASASLHVMLAACGLVALTFIAYYNSLSNGFVWDDHQQIVMNPTLRPAAPLTQIFSSDIRFAHQDSGVQNRTYRPLQMLTYRIVAGTFGLTPAPFHLCNLLLAIACVLAAFAVFRLLTRSTFSAFAAASLFAVYPIHTEAVDWIAASPDLGCTLFLLIAFALFLAPRRTEQARQPGWFLPVLSLAAYAISLLWKETASVLPILVIVYVLIAEKKTFLAALKASAAYWAVLALYLILRFSVLGGMAAGVRDWALTPFQFLLTTSHLMLSYWLKLAWPFRLNAYYVFSPIRSLADPRAIAGIVFVLAAIAGLVYLVRRAPLPAFAALWVCITLLPAMNIFGVGRNVFAERYLFLPSIGFCLLLTIVAKRLIGLAPEKFRKPAAISLLFVAVSAFAVATIQRNSDWKDDKALFAETLVHSPNAPFVRTMVASTQSDESPGSAEAEQNYLQAISLAKAETPRDRFDLVAAYKGLASLYGDRSDNQRALQMLASAREIAPADAETDTEEGLILVRAGRWDEAEPLLDKAVAAEPDNENVLSTLGIVAWQHHHDLGKAVEWFTRALVAHPDQDGFNASVHNNLGGVYGEQGDYVSAIAQYRLAVSISPQDPEYHTNLANALGAANHYDEARSEAELALHIAPNYPQARAVLENLGNK
jgi:tetratricopeptide (TPR) repeat protein